MTQPNIDFLELNLSYTNSNSIVQNDEKDINSDYLASPWYVDVIYVLKNLQEPPELSKSKARSVKLNFARYYILNGHLYWKDPDGILLNFLLEIEVREKINEFHKKYCGGHLFWKTTAYKILRAGFYWPTLFIDVYKEVSSCYECQIVEGNGKLMPLPLIPIYVETPFQQWGLDFIGEINHVSPGQHRWILTTIYYFTKWVEAIPTRQAIDTVIIDFMLSNILARFGCPRKIIIDNAKAFTSSKLVNLCNDYNIILSHSIACYPQGNGLAKSSNKNLVRTIKKLLKDNKKAWHSKLVYALWANMISTKKSRGTSPFQLVYGTDSKFRTHLGMSVMKYIQEENCELNPTQRKINQQIELHEVREALCDKVQSYLEKMKQVFDKRVKEDDFKLGDLVLKWNARHEDKGKHGKFDNLWKGPYSVFAHLGKKFFFLTDPQDQTVEKGPINGRFLKHYLSS